MLTRIEAKNFTAFDNLAVDLSPGLNLFVGRAGTGKTHLLKIAGAAVATKGSTGMLGLSEFATRLYNLMYYSEAVRREDTAHVEASPDILLRDKTKTSAEVRVQRGEMFVSAAVDKSLQGAIVSSTGSESWLEEPPVGAVMPFAESSTSLLRRLPAYWGDIPVPAGAEKPLASLEKEMGALPGPVGQGDPFRFLEGDRTIHPAFMSSTFWKLFALWLVLRTGELRAQEGAVLVWDNPTAGLCPLKTRALVEVVKYLVENGVQVLAATSDYPFYKEVDLQDVPCMVHALTDDGVVTSTYETIDLDIVPVHQVFGDLYKRDVRKSLGY